MRKLVGIGICLLCVCSQIKAQNLAETYISEWKAFYPSKAVKSGIHTAIFDYEDYSAKNVNLWLDYNKNVLKTLASNKADIDRIDARLLRVQAQSEVDLYEQLTEHQRSLRLYSRLISSAIPSVQKADFLLTYQKSDLYCQRLEAIKNLALAARSNLSQVPRQDLESGLDDLSKVQDYLKHESNASCVSEKESSVVAIRDLASFVQELLKNAETSEPVLGNDEYNRRLALYTDSELTSGKLAEMALNEIDVTKAIMVEVSREYLRATYPDSAVPENDLEAINKALADMEKDVPLSSSDYLQFWQELADASVAFIEKHDLVTLPEVNTLRIQNAPESAGPAARIGWVASAPPFHPNPVTVLNLPSIPESFPKQEQIDFWASFNKPFNRMIVIHELYPGHYTQLKISRKTPHPIRLLFPYGTYIEGWATLTEKVLLDAGWQKEDKLTLLAHLRKRLENANRAYISVQVHTNGWNKEQVLTFSTETSLVAPQFAKSLWGRIIRSPMQMTSYYLGKAEFAELLAFEQQRLGDAFNLKYFLDTIINAGPIPIDEFYSIFEQSTKS